MLSKQSKSFNQINMNSEKCAIQSYSNLQYLFLIVIVQKMIVVVKIIIFVTAFLIFLKIKNYQTAWIRREAKSKIITLQNNSNLTSIDQHNQVLNSLQEITAIPLIGSYYEEQKIQELLKLSKFSESLEASSLLLDSNYVIKPYRIWLLRAKAECNLNLFEQCQYSISRASYYAKNAIEDLNVSIMINQMNTNKILEKLKTENIKIDSQSIEGYMNRIVDKQNEIF